jgi:hypothetical protein
MDMSEQSDSLRGKRLYDQEIRTLHRYHRKYLTPSIPQITSRGLLHPFQFIYSVIILPFYAIIQDVPGEKVNILGCHSIGHSEQKLYAHVSYSERFPR